MSVHHSPVPWILTHLRRFLNLGVGDADATGTGREEIRRAAGLAGDGALKLRAGDALHLATAASLSARGVLCIDDAMIESAKVARDEG